LVGLDKENQPILENQVINSVGQLTKTDGIVADRSKVVQGWFDF
jgi:hypothetical protein